jgi:hypothetical protein
MKERRDIFNAELLADAPCDSTNDFIICQSDYNGIPKAIITVAEAKTLDSKYNLNFYPYVVCFYKDDYKFDHSENGIWFDVYSWIDLLAKFDGVITPDFSTYYDFWMPLKQYNTFRMRAMGHIWQSFGIPVINNVRGGLSSDLAYCFAGLVKGDTFAISTHGCIGNSEEKAKYRDFLRQLIHNLAPKKLFVYGATPSDVFYILDEHNIPYYSYETDLTRRLNKVAL